MRQLVMTWIPVLALVCVMSNQTFAQGRSQGAARSLSGLSRAGSAGGASQSAQGLSQATKSVGRAGAGMGHAANGLERANAVRISPTRIAPDGGHSRTSEQSRILEQRQHQAEHLRGISERNGNERLLDTADRMEANALQNHARQTELADSGAPSTAAPTTNRRPAPSTAPTRRGVWFQSR